MAKNYYMSDLHLSDEAVMKLCKRPFKTIEEMNDYIIDSINQRVRDDDTLYILGDVAPYNVNVVGMLRRIRCKKVLIVGNHDRRQLKHRTFRECFESIHENLMMKDGEYDLFLSHFPHAEWDGFYKGRYHFYGHVHNKADGGAALMQLLPQAVNVSADVLDEFEPKTAEELIKERLATYCPPVDLNAFLQAVTHPMIDDRGNGKKILPSRVVRLYAGMAPEYEVIRTNAPDKEIEIQMAICNFMEEWGYTIDNPYDYLERSGYFVVVLGSHDDFWGKDINEDSSIDYYDVDEAEPLFVFKNMYLEKITKYIKDNNISDVEDKIDRPSFVYETNIIDNEIILIGFLSYLHDTNLESVENELTELSVCIDASLKSLAIDALKILKDI